MSKKINDKNKAALDYYHCQLYRSDLNVMNTPTSFRYKDNRTNYLQFGGIGNFTDKPLKKSIPKTAITKHLTARERFYQPKDIMMNANSNVQTQKTTTMTNNNNLFNLTQKSSFRVMDYNNNNSTHRSSKNYKSNSNKKRVKYPKISLLRAKYPTEKVYLSIKKPHQGINWEPHCIRSISTASIVPNHYSFEVHKKRKPSVSFSSKNLFKGNKANDSKCFDYLKENEDLIRTDRMRKCLYKKRRYLQDFGLGIIKILYQINTMIIVIEPFSSFTINVYLLIISDEDNLAWIENHFESFDTLILALRYDDDNFIIRKRSKQLIYTTQVMEKKRYYNSNIEKDLNLST